MLTTRFVALILSISAVILGANVASGQTFPNKPVRILVSEAGGLLDIVARLIAQDTSGPLGQPVIVENRGGSLTADLLVSATPDGYTVGLGGGAIWLTPLLEKTTYDPVKDLSAITTVTTYPFLLVVYASLPVKSVKDLIDLAKAKPGVLNFAASGDAGGGTFRTGELFKAMAKINVVRVPYKGSISGIQAVISGESHFIFAAPANTLPIVKTGKLRSIAVTSLEPTPLVPGVPTIAAMGLPGFESSSVGGILAPGRTPAAIIRRMNQEIVRVISRPDMKEKLLNLGTDTVVTSPEQFAAMIKSEMAKWGKVFKDAGLKVER